MAPADSTTLPERRYTEYFIDGTQPGDPWAIFANGPITF
jgi:hypothetical protein